MDLSIIATLTTGIYLLAFALQLYLVIKHKPFNRGWLLVLSLLAICLHGVLLHRWIDIYAGQNLAFPNMLSLAAWLVAVLVLVVVLIKPVELLALIVFPVAALSIVLVLLFPQQNVINTAASPNTLFHILLAVLTFCVLCVAGLLALLLAAQEYVLHNHRNHWVIARLPPLETMETLLFQVIGLGFILLSVVIVTSIYFYYSMFWQHVLILQKTVIVMFAWVVFLILLIGRHAFGWRGRKAIYFTLGGVVLLFIAYFGSKFILEAL